MPVDKTPEEQQQEAEQMQNVLLLLNHLVENEQTTIKLIIDCLYEVGSVNLINQKVEGEQANRLARMMAKLSKPVAKVVALRWFKQNCPALITKWLRSKVAFKAPKAAKQVSTTKANVPAAPNLLPSSTAIVPGAQLQELQQLRGQVKILSGLLLCTLAALGGTAIYQVSLNVIPQDSVSQPVMTPIEPQ